MKIIIIDGATAAARLRRNDETAEIVLVEECEAQRYENPC